MARKQATTTDRTKRTAAKRRPTSRLAALAAASPGVTLANGINLQDLFDGMMRYVEAHLPAAWPAALRGVAVSGIETARVLVDTAGLPGLEKFLRDAGILTK